MATPAKGLTTKEFLERHRDPKWEEEFKRRGLAFSLRQVPVEMVDKERSRHNQARIGQPINDGRARQYAADIANGDPFPALVIVDQAPRGALIIDGNHRHEGYILADEDLMPAYVLSNVPPNVVTLLTFVANAKHGLPTSTDERVHQAAHLVGGGATAEEAARILSVPVGRVRAAVQVQKADQRADEYKIDRRRWDALVVAIKLRLGQVKTDEGFVALANLVLDAKLKSEAVGKAVQAVNQHSSARKQVAEVEQLRLLYKKALGTGGIEGGKAGPGRIAKTPRFLYEAALNQVFALPPERSVGDGLTQLEKEDLLAKTESAIGRLEAVKKYLTEEPA